MIVEFSSWCEGENDSEFICVASTVQDDSSFDSVIKLVKIKDLGETGGVTWAMFCDNSEIEWRGGRGLYAAKGQAQAFALQIILG